MQRALDACSAAIRPLSERYYRFFSVGEIESEPILQWFFGAMLFFFFVTFNVWIGSSYATVEAASNAVCWPYFQNCTGLYFLHALPYGYSQATFYMALYAVMMLIVWCMWKKYWSGAHALLALLLLWKTFVVFLLSYTISGPYDYYHIFLTAILLFVPFKEFFLKLSFVFMYFMSATTKLDSTWTLGTYFTALKTGLPIFPDALTLPITNLVIGMQIIGAWFLISRKMIVQRLALIFFTAFHVYSGILVYYRYPSVSVLGLIILFGPLYRYTKIPFSRKAIAGWTIIGLIGLFQVLGFVIPTDRRMTLEGNRFGMFMFEANHQCVMTVTSYTPGSVKTTSRHAVPGASCNGFDCLVETNTSTVDGMIVQEQRYESASAWNRCDPYVWFSQLQSRCASGASRIALREDHSINGGPFYRIVDVPDICSVAYAPFKRNDWIKEPPEAQLVGYPVENVYRY